jgi:shikimate 5-dehydrogenase
MYQKHIEIIGDGGSKAAIAEYLAAHGHNDVIIMTPDEAKEHALNPENRLAEIEYMHTPIPIHQFKSMEKEFVCKGKHEYRQVGKEWICQCGRKLND